MQDCLARIADYGEFFVSKILLQELQLHREVLLCEILGQEFVRHESQLLSIHIMEVAMLGSSVQIEYKKQSINVFHHYGSTSLLMKNLGHLLRLST
jgi:hypothetical protein